jgi:hypothetical protein
MKMRRVVLVAVLALALVPATAGAQAEQTPPAQQAPPAQQMLKPDLETIKRNTPQDALVPYIGISAGGALFGSANVTGDLGSTPMAYGASLLFWGPGLIAGEFDFCYYPDFYKGLDAVSPAASTNNYTMTLNFVVGPTFYVGEHMRVRPYGLIGGGLMRSSINDFAEYITFNDTQNLGVVDVGGGLYFYPARRIGFRGDVRYFMGVGADSSAKGWGDIEGWNYFRVTFGVAIAF